ncbi:hypothetical protein PAPYR_9527 [Paratrimastix pyriformis]|uniref:Uncharacterized protein n=1 Tax=Paratrimastix pyriformis TaxID=342808 RepID=A0ABQ8U845_9EUKA|nr:hypothetical protein PAPYR_9527 [Paratrimastix pyriformis]
MDSPHIPHPFSPPGDTVRFRLDMDRKALFAAVGERELVPIFTGLPAPAYAPCAGLYRAGDEVLLTGLNDPVPAQGAGVDSLHWDARTVGEGQLAEYGTIFLAGPGDQAYSCMADQPAQQQQHLPVAWPSLDWLAVWSEGVHEWALQLLARGRNPEAEDRDIYFGVCHPERFDPAEYINSHGYSMDRFGDTDDPHEGSRGSDASQRTHFATNPGDRVRLRLDCDRHRLEAALNDADWETNHDSDRIVSGLRPAPLDPPMFFAGPAVRPNSMRVEVRGPACSRNVDNGRPRCAMEIAALMSKGDGGYSLLGPHLYLFLPVKHWLKTKNDSAVGHAKGIHPPSRDTKILYKGREFCIDKICFVLIENSHHHYSLARRQIFEGMEEGPYA